MGDEPAAAGPDQGAELPVEAAGAAGRRQPERYRTERLVGISMGVAILVFVMALIWRGEPFTDRNLAVMTRIILALGIGAVGATIPGFLEVNYSLRGMVVRGTGGLALFLIAYFATPEIEALNLKAGELALQPLDRVELRALNAPRGEEMLDPNSPVALTIYLKGSNPADQLGRPVEIVETSATLATAERAPMSFDWKYFVRHLHATRSGGMSAEERHLGVESDVTVIPVPPGTALEKSIMHVPAADDVRARDLTWAQFLSAVTGGGVGPVRVSLQTRSLGRFEAECRIDLKHAKDAVLRAIDRDKALPRYLLTVCEGKDEWKPVNA